MDNWSRVYCLETMGHTGRRTGDICFLLKFMVERSGNAPLEQASIHGSQEERY